MALRPYRETYAIFLFDIKNRAEELSRKMGIGGMASLYSVAVFEECDVQMIYENEAPKAEARKLKHRLYKPLKHLYSRHFFNTYLREALLQDGFHFSLVSEEEMHNVNQWVRNCEPSVMFRLR